ncbi:hypothetical protein [Streptomyces camponoticapitis]|uniref:hypothetical protein n=1 Tax=Streptomyces camponoticapitis TaxID=1616125 RepID=UPI00166AF369|nr:hypothetical protein [Streptomyces camponoticapitis]
MNGRRPYNSGAPYGTWVAVGVLLKDERGEVIDQALVLIPAADLTVVDTWHTAGMRGTASYTLVGHDVFVPEHRVLSVPAAEIKTARPHIYRAADEDKSPPTPLERREHRSPPRRPGPRRRTGRPRKDPGRCERPRQPDGLTARWL